MDEETRIRALWDANAAAWTHAVRSGGIRSRRVATDGAILDAVLARHPRTALDIGCGEGWLVRALAALDIDVLGVDGARALIEQAQAAGPGRYRVRTQEALGEHGLDARFDVVTCNFALFGKTVVERLFERVPEWLQPGGALIIQTLHPDSVCDGAEARDGWRSGSWQGCGDGFGDAPPWYFRTLASWTALIEASGLRVVECRTPRDPEGGRALSLLLVAEAA
ncbi:class I SAM-dependent methyltransferase [Oleiagrimonas citrea]|uniref:Class I SAM-dependent methyltransferase n=1 Tax=Oleiagrimonas citrea TaxID=1665687 RepID=A0A846ZNU7_9GAMM|nr:class I SAM-dependent methyltransferase [Oleiagrimonas citrea]NKZ39189.1 class I SAM-dependent methyltransferase [Oleiagrimonas citrea]